MADQGLGWDVLDWLRKQGANIPTLTDVENASYGMPIGGEAVRSGLHAASLVGAPIGAAGAALGTAMSEAETENPGSADYLAAVKRGAAEGPRAALDNINVLDIASLGAGALGGGLMRGAKAATSLSELGRAAQLTKAAKAAHLVDLGLTGADASIGVGQAGMGIKEGNPAEVAMGLARVGGNLVGANSSLKDLGEGRALKSIIDELGLKDTQVADIAGAAKPQTRINVAGRGQDIKGQEFEYAYDKTGDPFIDEPRRAKAEYNRTDPERSSALGMLATTIRDMSDELHIAGSERMPDLDLEGNPMVGRLRSTPDRVGNVEQLGDTLDDVINRGPGATGGKMKTQYNMFRDSAERLKSRMGEFFGFIDSDAKGKSLAGKGMAREPKTGANPFWINPEGIAKQADYHFDTLMRGEGELTPEMEGVAQTGINKQVRAYVDGVRSGTIERTPELDKQMKIELWKNHLAYTVAHEDIGHTPEEASHLARNAKAGGVVNPAYYSDIVDKNGKYVTTRPDLMKTISPDRATDEFSAINNQIVRILQDPDKMVQMKARFDNPILAPMWERMYNASQPPPPEALLKSGAIAKKAGKTAGYQEHQAAKIEWLADEPAGGPKALSELDDFEAKAAKKFGPDWRMTAPPSIKMQHERLVSASNAGNPPAPPTPPSGLVPPGSPAGGETFGPQLKPLSERIRTTLLENRKVNVLNNQNKAEIRALKAQELQKIDDELASGRMTNEEAVAASSKVMSGEFGLEKSIAQMPITAAEKQMMTERLAQVQEEDRFVRMNNRESWAKMLKGERLTDGEVKSITDALNIKIEELKETPTIMKMLKAGENLIGGSRALMSSWDLSAAGRQALFASVTNPRETMKAFRAQMDALKMTPKEFASFMDTFNDPNLNPMRDLQAASGLHISHKQGGLELGGREEHFINAAWAEKVPGVLRTEQAYIAYLNKMRVELFNKGAKQLMDSGHAIQDADGIFNPIYQDLAYMVNTLTGRGEMSAVHISPGSGQGKLMGLNATFAPGEAASKNMHAALTNVFFAPRFAASRAAILRDATIGLAGGNLEWPVYKMYMKNVYGTIGVMGSLAAAVVATGAGTFNADPSRKDFGVLRVGKVRYDLFGGLKPWAKIAALIEQDKYYDKRGKAHKFGEYGGRTKTGDIGRFVQGKLSPASSLVLEAITGEDFMGKKSTAWNKAYSHFTPMILQTITEAIDEGEAEQLPLAVPAAVLGIGVNTYSDSRRKYQ